MMRYTLLFSLAIGTLFCTTSWSQHVDVDQGAAFVVVTGSRFAAKSDSSASVITAAEIQQAGIDNVNEAIRKLAGVYGRKSTRGTQDFDLDLSGFGVNSANNLVVLVDGVRLSENEQTAALLSSIPIDSVARIEILPSGGSVLYGEGATGGVIHIITQQTGPTPLAGFVTAEAGQFNTRSVRVALLHGWEKFNLRLNLNDLKSDSYRVNNAINQQNISAALTRYVDNGRVGLRLDSVRQQSGFPGSLTLAQFKQDPRQSQTPLDDGSIAIDRLSALMEKTIGNWQLAAELFTRDRTAHANFVSLPSAATYSGRQTGITPRLRHEMEIGNVHNELVVGLNWMNWNRQTVSDFSLDYATQQSGAIYFWNELSTEKARVSFGARREVFDKTSSNQVTNSVDNYHVVQGVNAWELHGSYAITPEITVFSKAGQSYRVANVDDNAYTSAANTPLLPQLSHDLEVGARLGDVNRQVMMRFFRHRLSNEIYFDPLINHGLGANTNLDPTERQGVAFDVKFRLSSELQFKAQLQHVNAMFTAGTNEGKELTLVPKKSVSAQLTWASGDGQKAYLSARWVGAQRYGGDFTNTCAALIPSHATLDARYSRTVGDWELAISGSNLTNKPYFTNAFGCRLGIYPDDGLQLKVGLRYGF